MKNNIMIVIALVYMFSVHAGDVKMVYDINTGPSSHSTPRSLKVFNNKLYFSAYNGINGRELWV